ncbi:autotransporter family protein [Zophobihabitans entericus]|uniref:Autotransporter outer membrane beta-barrel domain-containing protein n=1 Tax=Zophobihabitans entericus TaxID=1635327 RepID=A0A6G9I890_9GAMM|nr:autotransporter outer membrane beta-barrel domain-containing protein [Zophobihabitans entericus]QIQ20426.1 autotransporter outer membrane beta-barrel domain-containing protein [Zophobihabitans entericus]
MKRRRYTPIYLGVLLACLTNTANSGTTILTDSDFPRGHTFVKGAGNTLHIQNTGTAYLSDSMAHTGVLSSELNAILIVDDHVHVTNNGMGDAILVVTGAKAYFNNGLTAVVGAGNDYFALASTDAGSELHVTGTANVISPDKIGFGIYLGNNTKNSFDDVNVQAGSIGIQNMGVTTIDKQVKIDLNDIDTSSVGILNFTSTNGKLTLNDAVSINMTATHSFSGYNYGMYNSNNQADFNNGLSINFIDNGYTYSRIGVYSTAGTVKIANTLSILASKADSSYALFAINGGKILVNNALVNVSGHFISSGANSQIDMSTVAGSIIDGNTALISGGVINFNLTDSKWYFDQNSALTLLSGSDSDIYFMPSAGAYKTLTMGTLSGTNHTFWMQTKLDDGSSQETDKIIISQSGAGQHLLNITNSGGSGGLTSGDGIKVVEVNGTSTSNNFALNSPVRAGIYEYTLHQGSTTNAADQNWYLRTTSEQLNPDIGTYLGNQTAATGLFMHSLHDRLGEPQYAERFRNDNDSQSSAWVRLATTHSKNLAGGDLFKQHNTGYLVHLGGDIAQWTDNDNNRYHIGLMAAYGKNDTETKSQVTGSRVKGNIEGYSLGAYFTWYDNEKLPEGWYVDAWTMYNWFDNETQSSTYDSRAWTNSVEAGYAYKFAESERWQWMIEPHAQVAYTYYDADNHTDSNGVRVSDDDASGFSTRLGGRLYLRDALNQKNAQVFLEANWLYNSAKNTLRFNGEQIADNTPSNRFEVKAGMQGAITPKLHIYSHIGLQWGKDQYEGASGQVGVKYNF